MARGKKTVEDKQDLQREILRILQIPERPEYFSRGGTVTALGIKQIHDKLVKLIQQGHLNIL